MNRRTKEALSIALTMIFITFGVFFADNYFFLPPTKAEMKPPKSGFGGEGRAIVPSIETVSPTIIPSPQPSNSVQSQQQEFGKVEQVGNYTFEQTLPEDEHAATPDEILKSVNEFRHSNGLNSVEWSNELAGWAANRANFYIANGDIDEHQGFFNEAPQKAEEFKIFRSFKENGSIGGRLNAIHLIEWVYAADEPHKQVLLCDCTHLGVGVSTDGYNHSSDLIFGKTK